MERVDYVDTFIAATDSSARVGTPPPLNAENPSVAALTYRLIAENPYGLTSGDVIFTIHAERGGIPPERRAAARVEFYGKSRACLRASPLGKRFGWGIHADERGRLALYSVDSTEYAEFLTGNLPGMSNHRIRVVRAMRSTRR